jgi:acetyltransferase
VISLRPLCAQDGAAFQQFVRGLSPESRLHRFFVPLRELAPGLLASLTQVDQSRHVAVAAVEGDRIIGEGRFVALGDSGRAEFAVAVADEWQRHGVGARLLGFLTAAARQAGLAVLEGEVLRTNGAMLGLAGRAGFRRKPCADACLTVVERNLAAPEMR